MGVPMPNEAMVERARVRLSVALKGKYLLERVLGVGGMATVYAATHRNGKEFAIKVLHPELSVIDDIRSRFLREGYLANRVRHPGAVAVLDDDVTEDGCAFLVMELLHGESVESLWDRHGHRLPLELVIGIGLQLLEVLGAAHRRGVVHRDIKPENLLLLSDGHVKVLDFGIARVRGAAAGHTTEPGFTMGTPAFMAPEQALAELGEVDAQTDLWAAGATLFTLASGEIVHGSGSAQQVMLRAATEEARPLSKVVPGAPAPFCAVVDHALAFAKSDRWRTAEDMHHALRDAVVAIFGNVPDPARVAEIARSLDDAPTIPPASDEPSAPSALSVPRGAARTRRSMLGLGAAATLAALVAGIVVARVHGAGLVTEPDKMHSATTASSAPAASLAARPDAPSVLAAPSVTLAPTIREIALDQLPTAPEAPSVPPARPRPNAPPAVFSALSATPPAPSLKKPNCTPPFEFDSDGNKRWKRECL